MDNDNRQRVEQESPQSCDCDTMTGPLGIDLGC